MENNNILIIVLTSGFAGALITKIFEYLTARLNVRTRQERGAELLQQYLKINEISSDQLEESINQVWKLTTQNLAMEREISELKAHRTDRDDQIEAMGAQIAALQEQINRDSEERQALRRIIEEKDKVIAEVRSYMRGLLDWFEQRNIADFPIPGDDLLDTHSRIRLKNKRRDK